MTTYASDRFALSRSDTWRRSLTADARSSYLGALGTVLLGALVTAAPVAFHVVSQPMAVVLCVLLSVLLTTVFTTSVPVALIVAYVFQNLFVAMVSPYIDTIDQLNSIRAYNFVMTATVWLVLTIGYWLDRADMDRRMRLMIDVTTGVLILIGIYFAVGVASSGESAATYLRNIAAPFLLFQIFALVAYRYSLPFIKALVIIAVATAAYGFCELFAQQALFHIFNGDVYISLRVRQEYEAGVWLKELQQTGHVMRSYLDSLVIDFLNTPLIDFDLRLYRLLGPNFHSISFAYALTVFALILAASGRWWWPLLTLPLLAVIGSKGALVALFLVTTFLLLAKHVRMFRNISWYFATLAAYAAAGIAVGIRAGDYHVIGFIGGLRGFIANPLGRGIGAGGNLSLSVSSFDWSTSQQLGHTDVALESSVGVLLYQMGVAAIAVLAVLFWITLTLWRHYRATRQPMYAAGAFGIAVIVVNGIFQEEAMFAPLALGLMCAFAGLMLGATYRAMPTPARIMMSAVPRPAVGT
jgi:hypothetical protein